MNIYDDKQNYLIEQNMCVQKERSYTANKTKTTTRAHISDDAGERKKSKDTGTESNNTDRTGHSKTIF